MALNRVDTLFELYSIGRKFRSLAKQKNHDTMLTAVILRGLVYQSLSVSHLGVRVSMKPSAMSEKVQMLIASGLVAKKHGTDERELVVSITAKGTKELGRIVRGMKSHIERKFGSVTDEEMITLVTILKKITASL